MARIELKMPKMGESIIEATILSWQKKTGDPVSVDETLLEIATDKVDSDIPSPVEGIMGEILYHENDVVEVGKVIAYIETEVETIASTDVPYVPQESAIANPQVSSLALGDRATAKSHSRDLEEARPSQTERFYSPLVRNIAATEHITVTELDTIVGSGLNGRVTKADLLQYIEARDTVDRPEQYSKSQAPAPSIEASSSVPQEPAPIPSTIGDQVEIIEMDRMRRLISDHMVNSKRTSAHVTSFVEADVTEMVQWRNRIKDEFFSKFNEKITFTPLFIAAVVKAIQDFPRINASVDGNQLIIKKYINVGMATALPNGNLIVPVIRNADHFNLIGLTKTVNNLAYRARENQLKPDDISDGTFTLTNVGTFGNVMGTPIINQPQVAILATGAIRKMPAVIETAKGDAIAIRHKMFLSLSYDHRVVDGFLGGSFLRRIADYLEQFDTQTNI